MAAGDYVVNHMVDSVATVAPTRWLTVLPPQSYAVVTRACVGEWGKVLANSLAVVNAKGGVGKTAISANVAATAALGGWRVLLVDLDPQGNLARDLGYREASDEGKALLQAVLAASTVEPMRGVREGLDVVAGGRHTRRLADLLMVASLGKGEADYQLEPAFEELAGAYDLMIIDCPPAMSQIVRNALAMAHFAVIPTKIDDASVDGLEGLAEETVDIVATVNPHLYVLGVVMFDVGAGDTKLRAQARRELEEALTGIAPVFDTTIRHSRRGAYDMRRRGEVAAEYEQAALSAQPWYLDPTAPSFSTAAEGLAGDYQRLTTEILTAVAARRDGGGGE